MKWFITGGTGNLQGLSLPVPSLLLLSNSDWVTGQPKPLFETFASALLAGI